MQRREAERLAASTGEWLAHLKTQLELHERFVPSPHPKAYTALACCIDAGSIDTESDSYGWFVVFFVAEKMMPEFVPLGLQARGMRGFALVAMDVKTDTLIMPSCCIYQAAAGNWWGFNNYRKPDPNAIPEQ